MTVQTPPTALAKSDRSGDSVALRTGADRLMRVSSRLAVWGFVGGFGAMMAQVFGAPISLGLAIALMGGGVLVSGLGTATASFLAYRRLARTRGLLKTASMVGMPLGASLVLLGLTALFQWSPLVAVVNAIVPAAVVLGGLVIVLLMVGFILQWQREDEDRLEDI